MAERRASGGDRVAGAGQERRPRVHLDIGHVEVIQSVAVVARVQAFVERVDFEQGSDVKSGQVLYTLQKAPYEAAFHSAQAFLAAGPGRLRERRAAVSAHGEAQAAARRGCLAIRCRRRRETRTRPRSPPRARIGWKTAGINLGYTTIASPIDGRIGATAVTKGKSRQGTSAGAATPLATVVQFDPIRVVFAVPDRDIVSAEVKSGKDEQQLARGLVVGLELSDGTPYQPTGSITFFSNKIDPGDRTRHRLRRHPQSGRPCCCPAAIVNVRIQQAQPKHAPAGPGACSPCRTARMAISSFSSEPTAGCASRRCHSGGRSVRTGSSPGGSTAART